MEFHNGTTWKRFGQSLGPGDPPGSLSSNEPDGRQVYLFGYHDGAPGVWHSVSGVDIEDPRTRRVFSAGLVRFADLAAGPHEMPIIHPSGDCLLVRFRLKD